MRAFIASAGCLACLVFGGCAPHWTRPDSRTEWVDQDEAACQRQAEFLTSSQSGSFYGSLMDFYGQNYRPSAGRRSTAQWMGSPGPMFDIDPVRRTLEEDRLTENCMRAKGYTPAN